MATRYADAVKAVGGLSRPSKMPTLSWSTPPALTCGTGSKLAVNTETICGSCYARKGFYAMPDTVRAMARRERVLREALADAERGAQFVSNFVTIIRERLARTARLIARTGAPGRDDGRAFRWHDAGDVVSLAHLRMICAIAEATPEVAYWLPTKEAGIVRAYLETGAQFPSNLRVRLSVPRLNRGVPPAYARLAALSPQVTFAAAHSNTDQAHLWRNGGSFAECGAPANDGECGACRACWTRDEVSYNLH